MATKTRPPIRRLIFDLETSPNVVFSWRTGYKLNIDHDNILQERAIICVCYKWEGTRGVKHLEWNQGDDKELVGKFLEVAKEADEMVAHNGDKFDIKWLNTRAIKHGYEPVPQWKTVDTLVIAKRRFLFNSNRLDYLGKFLLGEGKISTSFSLWKDIVLKNCDKAMRDMVRYCKRDVELLERVWKLLEPYHTPKTHVGTLAGGCKWTCPWTGSIRVNKHKTKYTSHGTPQHQMQSKETGGYYTISQQAYDAYREHVDNQKPAKK